MAEQNLAIRPIGEIYECKSVKISLIKLCRANTSQNICEVQIKDESNEPSRLPLGGGPDINGFFPAFNNDNSRRNSTGMTDMNSDFFNFIKGQYLAQNEHLYRNLSQSKSIQMATDENSAGVDVNEERLKEHVMRMEILKVELETAKIKKEIAEINKEMLLKQLNK